MRLVMTASVALVLHLVCTSLRMTLVCVIAGFGSVVMGVRALAANNPRAILWFVSAMIFSGIVLSQ